MKGIKLELLSFKSDINEIIFEKINDSVLKKKIEDQLAKEDVLKIHFYNVDGSLVSAFRRIMQSEVPTLAIDWIEPSSENNCVLHDEFIAHRIGLLPLNSKRVEEFNMIEDCDCEGCPRCTLEFDIDVQVDKTSTENVNVYAKDLIPDPNHSDIVCVYPDTLITKLSPGSRFKMKAIGNKGIGKNHVKWSPVIAPSSYPIAAITLDNDIISKWSDKDKESFIKSCPKKVYKLDKNNMMDIENVLECDTCESCINWCKINKKDMNSVQISYDKSQYVLRIESSGSMPCRQIFQMTLKLLIEKLKKFLIDFAEATRHCLGNIDDENFKIKELEIKGKGRKRFEIIMNNEDHTIGHLLVTFLQSQSNVYFVGYRQDHPLENKIRFDVIFKPDKEYEYTQINFKQITHPLYFLISKVIKEILECVVEIENIFKEIAYK